MVGRNKKVGKNGNGRMGGGKTGKGVGRWIRGREEYGRMGVKRWIEGGW